MCVEQGDYKTSKEKYYKCLTFLSNELILYLQDKTSMIILKHLLQYSKLICWNFQPLVQSFEKVRSFPFARSFQNICVWL
jgi:c-di-AMP phosphodiesterase-like protein